MKEISYKGMLTFLWNLEIPLPFVLEVRPQMPNDKYYIKEK